jgi:hypothetical protein
MIRAFVFLIALLPGIPIYFGIVFLIGITMGPEVIRNSGAKGQILITIATLIILGILIKIFTEPEELREEDFEEE